MRRPGNNTLRTHSRNALSGPFNLLFCRVTRTLWRRNCKFWEKAGGPGSSTSRASPDVDGVSEEKCFVVHLNYAMKNTII
jgi:hypothetical protein